MLRHDGSRFIVPLLLLVLIFVCAAQRAIAADSAAIDLTDQPVVTGSGLAPNILVAVDNSGSMDFETLFPTDNGLLFWEDNNQAFWSSGDYVQDGNAGYAYLFPNGYNNCNGSNCSYRDRRIYSAYLALPPIPAFGFARDPEFNKAYFNPATNYSPWINRDKADPSAAFYDPEIKSGTLNLTQNHESNDSGETFDFQPGMVIPAGVSYYHTVNASSQTTANNICYRSASDYYSANLIEIIFQTCYQRSGYTYRSSATVNGGTTTKTGFYPAQNDVPISSSTSFGVSYYPATFYLKQSTALPSDFGWKSGAQKIPGQGPNGEALYGYQIKPENFTSTNAYNAAIQNFANWFTYYRKRSLAIRGGITSAFDRIGRVRVGSCTITDAQNRLASMASGKHYLTMTSLPETGDNTDERRRDFYESIYDLDFSQARGTPNRPALYYLGRELENNPDIIQSPCQRNYALLFTDGYNSGTVSAVGNVDGKYASTRQSPIPDDYTNTMADIAMRFYKDLNPPSDIGDAAVLQQPNGCPNDESLDCEQKPHMTTFGITLGQRGYIFGSSAYPAQTDDPYTNTPPWYLRSTNGSRYPTGDLPTEGPQEIDDLWHAAINSRGALLNASSPQELASKFSDALNQILGRGETLTNAVGSSTTLTADSAIFQTSYKTSNWTGDLIAFKAQSGSTAATERLWSAASQLGGVDNANADDGRTIITALRSDTSSAANGTVSGVPFTSSGLSSAGIPSLTTSAIAYLRGHRDQEKTGAGDDTSSDRIYRNRGDTVLGDIINSVPVYVGSPSPLRYAGSWRDDLHPDQSMPENDGQAYYNPGSSSSFVSQQTSRDPMVYVGANDGMLHGFNADTGVEKLAYIPNAMLSSLAGGDDPLTSPSYVHRSFVDGQIATGPAYFDGRWHTMLVGGLRNGGDIIYGLDVTSPSGFKQSNASNLVRWEFHAPGLGKTFGTPSIVRLHNGEWAAIFGNGYNSDDYGASLYVVDIADGHEIAHLTTGATPSGAQQGNGLATPAPVDIDGDHVTDYVYAGDLYGNVWRFDLTSSNPDAWSDRKIFQATAADGSTQPITTQVQVAAHPNGVGYGVMIYFGTGQDIQPLGDYDSTAPNSFYGIWDPDVISYDPGSGAPTRPSNWTVDRSQLVAQRVITIEPENGVDGLSYRTVSDDPITYINVDGKFEDRGWVIDLPDDSGEAILNPPTIVDDNVEFTTTVINRQTCSLTSSGYFMAVNRANGGPAAEDIFDVNGDGVVDDKDATDQRVAGVGFGAESGSPGQGPSFNDLANGTQVVRTPLTGGGTATITLARHFLNGRRSWHEIRR